MGLLLIFLFLGCIGQSALYGSAFDPIGQKWMVWLISLFIFLPCILVYFLTFTNAPPLPPRPYRIVTIFSMFWFATLSIAAEILLLLGYMPPNSQEHAITISRIIMHIGWISFIPMYYMAADARRAEENYYEPTQSTE